MTSKLSFTNTCSCHQPQLLHSHVPCMSVPPSERNKFLKSRVSCQKGSAIWDRISYWTNAHHRFRKNIRDAWSVKGWFYNQYACASYSDTLNTVSNTLGNIYSSGYITTLRTGRYIYEVLWNPGVWLSGLNNAFLSQDMSLYNFSRG